MFVKYFHIAVFIIFIALAVIFGSTKAIFAENVSSSPQDIVAEVKPGQSIWDTVLKLVIDGRITRSDFDKAYWNPDSIVQLSGNKKVHISHLGLVHPGDKVLYRMNDTTHLPQLIFNPSSIYGFSGGTDIDFAKIILQQSHDLPEWLRIVVGQHIYKCNLQGCKIEFTRSQPYYEAQAEQLCRGIEGSFRCDDSGVRSEAGTNECVCGGGKSRIIENYYCKSNNSCNDMRPGTATFKCDDLGRVDINGKDACECDTSCNVVIEKNYNCKYLEHNGYTPHLDTSGSGYACNAAGEYAPGPYACKINIHTCKVELREEDYWNF